MSMLDSELIFSGTKASGAAALVGQTITASGDTDSTSYVDTLAAGDAIKAGATFKAMVSTSIGGATTYIRVRLLTCAEITFASPTTLIDTGQILVAAATAKTILTQAIIPVGVLRYLSVRYTTDNTASGAVASFIVLNAEKTLDKQL